VIKTINLILLSFCLVTVNPHLAEAAGDKDQIYEQDQPAKYDRKFRRNYKKYKSFSPQKKERFQKLSKSVQGLTPEQKRKLRERVLKSKDEPNR